MSFSRCIRGVGSAVAVAALIFAGDSTAQTVYVNVETGNDGNFGQTPGTAVQTISRALSIAAGNLTIAWTIQIAGRVDDVGQVFPYDDNSLTNPPSAETFPLQMLRDVSLAWDQTNSEMLPVDPPVLARPLIRSAVTLQTLVDFSGPGYVPNSPVTISGIDFENGQPAITIPGDLNGTRSVILEDLRIHDSEPSVLSNAAGFAVDLNLRSCLFDLVPPVPAGIVGNQPLVNLDAGPMGSIVAVVDSCSFRATGNIAPPSGLRLAAAGGAILTATVSASLFVGEANGLQRGIDLDTTLLSTGFADGLLVDATVSGCTFEDCFTSGVAAFFGSAGGPGAANDSTVRVTGCTFDGNGGAGGGARMSGELLK